MPSHDAFLAEIYAKPELDDTRWVYADWLLEQHDPASASRGTFIMLQLRAHRGDRLSYQEHQLIKHLYQRHRQEWLGATLPLFSRARLVEVRFARGFLASASLRLRTPHHRALAADPMFSTLATLGCADAHLVVRPHMRSLHSLSELTMKSFAALAELPFELAIESVHLSNGDWTAILDARVRAAAAPVFANLRRLHARLDDPVQVDWLLGSWLPARLARIHLGLGEQHVVPRPLAARLMAMVLAHPTLVSVTCVAVGGSCTFVQPQGRRGVVVRMWHGDGLLASLDGVDGTGWHLQIETLPGIDTPAHQLAARFATFESVEVGEISDLTDD
ncbi:MAG: TIGR02996 domain-containing protein [Deltaproteobacteria bacterium]|nr:TIGR02996 domain-containing protein [Deltaproteobacteria bacterium]MDQ3298918.1 TIGR02996 domain-containing protein [Myxococcota bacterium]